MKNGRGDQVESELIRPDGTGWQTIEVSIRIPQGVNYTMSYKDGGVPLGTTRSNVDFPYVLNDIMTIVGDETVFGLSLIHI